MSDAQQRAKVVLFRAGRQGADWLAEGDSEAAVGARLIANFQEIIYKNGGSRKKHAPKEARFTIIFVRG